MSEVAEVIGILIARAVREREAGQDLSVARAGEFDLALERVYELVTAKLHDDPAFDRFQIEAAESEEVAVRTRARVQMSLEDAVDDDRVFADKLATAVKAARETGDLPGLPAPGPGSVSNVITGSVSGNALQARDIHGDVSF